MKLKFFIAGMAIVAGLASAVSCQDLSKDLTALQNKVNSLESTVQALQSKIDAGAVITSVTPSNSGIKITLSNGNSYEITNGVNGKDGANGKDGKDGKDGAPGSVVTIGENGNWFIDGEDTGLAAQGPAGADGADGTPGTFFVPNPETGCFDVYTWDEEKGEYVVTPTEISFITPGTITAVYNPLTGVVTLYGIEGYEGGYEIGGGSHGDAVTAVEIVTNPTYPLGVYPLSIASEQDAVFGPEGDQIEFKASNPNVGLTTEFYVKVSPANVTLDKDDVQLINSKGESYDKLKVVDVELYDGVITKASDFAIWKVIVALEDFDPEVDEEDFEEAFIKGTKKVAYAAKVGEALTAYDIAFVWQDYAAVDVMVAKDIAIYEGTTAKDITGLKAYKYTTDPATPDYAWKASTKKNPTPTTAAKIVTTGDNANVQAAPAYGASAIKASIGKPITIEASREQYRAFYVSLDLDQCDPADPSEEAAWLSYDYEGLDVLCETGELEFAVTSAAADGDEVGFRLYAVNWDGTLADPDGVRFVVVFGADEEEAAEWDAVATVVTPAYNGDFATNASELAAISTTKLFKASTYALVMDDKNDPTFDIVNLYDKDKKPVAAGDWTKVKYIQTKLTDTALATIKTVKSKTLYQNYVDGKEYKATLNIYDANGFVLATCPVSVKKNVPTAEPAEAAKWVNFKTNVLVDGVATLYAENASAWTPSETAYTTAVAQVMALNPKAATYKNDLAKATMAMYSQNLIPGILDLGSILTLTAPTGAKLAKADFVTSMALVPTYVDKDGKDTTDPTKAEGVYLKDHTLGTTVESVWAYNFDGVERVVKTEYNYGDICRANDGKIAEKKVPVTSAAFKIKFTTYAQEFSYDWNWNLMKDNAGYQTTAPTHNSRLNYEGGAGVWYSTTFPGIVNAAPWTKGAKEEWSDDPFTVNYPLGLRYGSGACTSLNVLDIIYATSSAKTSRSGYISKQEATNNYLFNVTDANAKYYLYDATATASATLIENGATKPEYWDLTNKDDNKGYSIAPVASPAADPSTIVPATLTIVKRDVAFNPVVITVPVNIYPTE